MKFTATYENLKSALQSIEGIAAKNISIPIVENILMEVKGGICTLSATNLEIGIIRTLSAKVESEGKVVIPPILLTGFLGALRGGEHITLEKKDDNVIVTSGSYESVIMGHDSEEYPIIPKEDSKDYFTVSVGAMRQGISAVMNYATHNDIRLELTGVYMHQKDDRIYFAATDSFRLGELSIATKEFFGDTQSVLESPVIIPQKMCHYITHISDLYDTIGFTIVNNHLVLVNEELYVTSRLIDGQYPDYSQIIPSSFETSVIFKKEDVVEVMRVMMVFLGKDTHEITLSVEEDTVVIGTRAGERGMSTTSISGSIEGPAVSLVVNPRYILDGLKNVKEDDVYIGINGEAAPIVVRSVGKEGVDENFTYIVMPIKSAG